MDSVEAVSDLNMESAGEPVAARPDWQYWVGAICAFLMAALWLVAGLWKMSDLSAMQLRMTQLLVPVSLSMPATVALAISEHNPTVGALLAGVLVATAHERGLDLEVLPRALELIGATRCGRGAWVLGELGRWPGIGETGERARELAMALNDLGVATAAPRPGAFSHGFVGPVDGGGTRRLALFFRSDEGTLHGLLMRLNDVSGVEDVGTVVDLVINFPDLSASLSIKGEVVWVNREPPMDMGIRYVEMDNERKEMLRKYISMVRR